MTAFCPSLPASARAALAASLVALAACGADPAPVAVASPDSLAAAVETVAPSAAAPDPDVTGVSRVRARIQPVGRGDVSGTVTLAAVTGGVRVLMDLDGLSRQDFHGVHILAGRDCDANPSVLLGARADGAAPHGGPYSLPGQRLAGALGNIRGDGGDGRYDRIDTVVELNGTDSALGRAVVVRAGRDDGVTPGAAGDVIGCGIFVRV